MTRDEREMLYLVTEVTYMLVRAWEIVNEKDGSGDFPLADEVEHLRVCLNRYRNVIERDREVLEKQAKEIASLSRQENANEANIWMGQETQARQQVRNSGT